MKVVVINNDFPGYWRGRLVFLKEYLKSKDIELHAVELFGKGSPYTFEESQGLSTWWKCLFPDNSSEELKKKDIKEAIFAALNELDADVVISSSIVFYSGALSIRWAKRNGRKFVMFEDARPVQIKRNLVVQWVKDLITVQADALWLPSPEYATDYAYFKNKQLLLFYGFSCVDNELFRPFIPNSFNNKIIICVARLVPVKNLENLLRAWMLVQQNAPDYKLIIVGTGPQHDQLMHLKNELSLTSVNFLGSIDNNKLPQLYQHADAFVLASTFESWGLVVNEAMAAGLPLLLSNRINAANILLKESVNGFGFDPLNVQNMAAEITRFIKLDNSLKVSMSESSLTIVANMTYEKMGSQLVTAIELINTRKFKPSSLLATLIMKLWYGRYNKGRWDNF